MANDNSFDVVSKVEVQEVKNAIDQASKEVNARFDLKNSKSTIALEGDETIQLASQDDYTLKAVIEILQQKLVKRNVSLKNLEYEKIEPASGSSVRQKIKLKQGIESDVAKKIVAAIKDSKRRHKPQSRVIPYASPPRTATRSRRSSPCCAARISASTFSSPTTAQPSLSPTESGLTLRPRHGIAEAPLLIL